MKLSSQPIDVSRTSPSSDLIACSSTSIATDPVRISIFIRRVKNDGRKRSIVSVEISFRFVVVSKRLLFEQDGRFESILYQFPSQLSDTKLLFRWLNKTWIWQSRIV